ncbi:23442_t:CDS:2, partial [Entrophospora sp. SA101]
MELQKEYEEHLIVTDRGTTSHDSFDFNKNSKNPHLYQSLPPSIYFNISRTPEFYIRSPDIDFKILVECFFVDKNQWEYDEF